MWDSYGGELLQDRGGLAEHAELVGAQLVELPGEPRLPATTVLPQQLATGVGDGDDDLTTIGLVRHPADEPAVTQRRDHARHRRRLHPLMRRERSQRQRTV